MNTSAFDSILRKMLVTTSPDNLRSLLIDLGDHSELGLDQPFGPHNLLWHAFGDNPSNLSTIGLATQAGRSLTERLTNAIDAVLEDRLPLGPTPPHSARQAASQWFGRPISGPDDGLFRWNYSETGYDRRIFVVLNPSGSETAPTVDVWDKGTGIEPLLFPKTILSLQAGNKIQKWYLIGAFGQGGASTLAFSEYVLIVSRHKASPQTVAFTVIKVLNLNETYKEDSYAYLALKDTSGNLTVPSYTTAEDLIAVYDKQDPGKLPQLGQGTLVRHYRYKLNKINGTLAPSPGNLYHFLHCSLFDPLLPFRVVDLRSDEPRDELVTGSRNRLMRLTKAEVRQSSGEDSGPIIRHYRPMEYIVPYGTHDASIGIEYWVVLNFRKGTGAKRNELVLRSHSNDHFVQTGHPILATLNGQNQGELSAQILKDLGLGMVSRHIVIHIDATGANTRVRRELFSSNREGFKEGDILRDLTRTLENMIQEDEALYGLERELTDKLVEREAQSTSDEVIRQVTSLLLEAGLQVKDAGPSLGPGQGKKQAVHEHKKRRYRQFEPLPTLPFPDVTKFRIVSPLPAMKVRIGDNELILIETDADSEFDRRGWLAIRSEPDLLEVAAKAPLRGGRIRWRLRPRQNTKPGDTGRVIATLTKPDGSQLRDEIEFDVLTALEDKSKKEKGYVPPFKIIPINPEDNPEQWGVAWPNLADGVSDIEQSAVAYKPVNVGGAVNVYYSTIFSAFRDQLERLKSEKPALSELFKTNYEVWIGYHAILQENSRKATTESRDLEEETLDSLFEDDRVRVAKMQVKQAVRSAELIQKVASLHAAE